MLVLCTKPPSRVGSLISFMSVPSGQDARVRHENGA
jgi:hypothetical protein